MPYGRGGAGNIQAIEQEKTKIAADLEANHTAVDDYTSSAPTEHIRSDAQQYKQTGRGGAGNIVDSTGIKRESDMAQQMPRPTSTESTARATYGRGGAGNHEFGAGIREAETARKTKEETMSHEQLNQYVERRVTEQLAMPQKAKLNGESV